VVIDASKLNNDHYAQFKGAIVKYQYKTGETFPSTNLGFCTDSLHVAVKDIVTRNAGPDIKADAIKGSHIVAAYNKKLQHFSLDIKASLAPYLNQEIAKKPTINIGARPPSDPDKLVLLRLILSASTEVHKIAQGNVGKQKSIAWYFMAIPDGMPLEPDYYITAITAHYLLFGFDLNGPPEITRSEADAGGRSPAGSS